MTGIVAALIRYKMLNQSGQDLPHSHAGIVGWHNTTLSSIQKKIFYLEGKRVHLNSSYIFDEKLLRIAQTLKRYSRRVDGKKKI